MVTVFTVLSLQRRKKPTKEVTKPTLPGLAVSSEEVPTSEQRQEYSDSQLKVTIFHTQTDRQTDRQTD